MQIADLDYELPEGLIAQEPLAERDASRLLVVDVASSGIEERMFADLPTLLPSSLFIFNDTRVFPARLTGHNVTGGKVEILLLRKRADGDNRWLAMGRSSKGLRTGMGLSLCDGRLRARVVRTLDQGRVEVDLETEGDVAALI